MKPRRRLREVEIIITRKKLFSMSIFSTFLTVQGQSSPRFHVEALLPFRLEPWNWLLSSTTSATSRVYCPKQFVQLIRCSLQKIQKILWHELQRFKISNRVYARRVFRSVHYSVHYWNFHFLWFVILIWLLQPELFCAWSTTYPSLNGDIVIPKIVVTGFCSIHFTLGFAGQTNVDRYTGNIVLSQIVKPEFHCNIRNMY